MIKIGYAIWDRIAITGTALRIKFGFSKGFSSGFGGT